MNQLISDIEYIVDPLLKLGKKNIAVVVHPDYQEKLEGTNMMIRGIPLFMNDDVPCGYIAVMDYEDAIKAQLGLGTIDCGQGRIL